MMQVVMSIIASVLVCVAPQTVYIDIDTGKVVGVEPNKHGQINRAQYPNYPRAPLYPNYPMTQYPNQGPQFQQPQHHSHYPYQPQYQPQQPHQSQRPHQPQHQEQKNNLKAEWVCRHTTTQDTMIIASEAGYQMAGQPVPSPIPNQQNKYQDNPWLKPQEQSHTNFQPNTSNGVNQDSNQNHDQHYISPEKETERPPIILTTTTPRSTPSPSLASSTKSPFPSFDNIDWTSYIGTTTNNPSNGGLSQAIDGDGIIEPRFGGR